ncbi:uncharacterized protein ALTATR162_LOCUS3046 [Alternaria atra]|uniref:Uncharacterized protein n=1 Tax=Alternaria atra TaxID=119953 RepID=A0A8J2MZQ1_9PLEO|nr:uncharacterized protein ALTATR162_LOCUS3046 [Alternaria atra]CAG5153130.1 unnamed protein product [Alternaria atra]
MGVKDSDYAFIATEATQRRYMYLAAHLPSASLATAQLPYFEILDIEWLDVQFVSDAGKPNDLRNASMQANLAYGRNRGTLGFWMTEKWESSRAIGLYAHLVTVYDDKRNVSILVGRLTPHGHFKADDDWGTNTT